MGKLRHWTLMLAVMAIGAAARSAPGVPSAHDLLDAAHQACEAKPEVRCLADQLDRQPPPVTERELDDRAFAYAMLGKFAYEAGDFPDARKLYEHAKLFAKRFKKQGGEADFANVLFKFEESELAISMRDYAAALRHIDEFSALREKDAPGSTIPEEYSQLRCAALIGLRRKEEANACLQTLLKGLKFEEKAPWEGVLFGPQGLNPYETARRIAAHETREGRLDSALNLLERIEILREKVLRDEAAAAETKNWPPGVLWAALLDPADLLEDKAAVLLAQGEGVRAKVLLLAASKLRLNAQPGPGVRPRQVDPLADTLGLINKR